jgi:hypothetical protein
MYGHRNAYKRWVKDGRPRGAGSEYTASCDVFETGNEVTIELIEKPEVTCKEELIAREGHFIRELDCVNKFVVGRTHKEWRQLPEIKERLNARARERWANDPEYRAIKNARNHTPEANERSRQWKAQRIKCDVCGATTTKGSYSRHKKSKYCLEAAAKAAQDDSDM